MLLYGAVCCRQAQWVEVLGLASGNTLADNLTLSGQGMVWQGAGRHTVVQPRQAVRTLSWQQHLQYYPAAQQPDCCCSALYSDMSQPSWCHFNSGDTSVDFEVWGCKLCS